MNGHLWLVGMMGSGKSSVGERLARRLDRPFVDVDRTIASRMGCSIAQLWGDRGEAAFRDLEAAAVDRVADGEPAVVATGGGAVLNAVSVERMRTTGKVVWLTASIDTLDTRLARSSERPLLLDEDPRTRLEELLEARHDRYLAAAHMECATDELTIADVVDRIEEWWNES